MKRVGIVTFYGVNYGSALQVYALMKKIQEYGYDVNIIDYKDTTKYYGKIVRLFTLMGRVGVIQKTKVKIGEEKAEKRCSVETVKKFEQYYHDEIIFSNDNYLNPRKYDAFIAGSDQIWGINIPGLHYVHYLRFTSKNKRIAYAPSFGGNEVPVYNKKRLEKYLKGMRYISVREESGIDIVEKSIGRRVIQAIDPTLLVGKEFWDNVIPDNKNEKDYIFCYFLDHTSLGYQVIEKLMVDSNLEVWWADIGANCDNASYVKKYFSPFEFVNAIKNAKYIVTDSYHAMLFSILYSKNFYVVERNYRRNQQQSDRIVSMLNLLKIENRYIKTVEDLIRISDKQIYDTEQVEKVIIKKRKESEQYLADALKEVCL